ncbi:hypothetical protein Patl1_27948 [Pistacia atlantica]|uniref:Uncharacterized protein n=1 Tax=Pistacia atlantica TaxID=434234 RepID=A0ACC1BD18_9ROSI|nr:hypothetical protein Patl1_27948 [Pistacia atlantica]
MEKRQQELQFLGFFGIFKESFRIIFSKPKTLHPNHTYLYPPPLHHRRNSPIFLPFNLLQALRIFDLIRHFLLPFEF